MFDAVVTSATTTFEQPFMGQVVKGGQFVIHFVLLALTLRLSGARKRVRSSRLFAQLLDLVHQPSYHAEVDDHLCDPFWHKDFNSARVGLIEVGKLLVWRMHDEE